MSIDVAALRTSPPPHRWGRFGDPEYTDWLDESMSWKQTCYIGDWSFLWQHRLHGRDAIRLLSDVSVNSFENFRIGQSKHAIHTNRDGKVIHEGIVTRLGDDDYVIHGRGGFWVKHRLDHGDYGATIEPDDWFIFQVSGPTSLKVLDKVTGGRNELRATKRMWHTEIEIAGHRVRALRQGMAGELGFELQGPRAAGQEVYDAILEAGQEFGLRRLGARVVAINHLEAHYPNFAREYMPAIFDSSDPDMAEYAEKFMSTVPPFANLIGSYEPGSIEDLYRSPIELGWERNIKFDHDFIGREALEEELRAPTRTMRTLVWNGDDVVDVYASLFRPGENYQFMEMPRDQRDRMWADKVTAADGTVVGVSTSRGYSYYFREMLSLCVLDNEHAEIGTDLILYWGNPDQPQKQIRVTVAPAPYKTDRSRGDLTDQ